MAAVTPDTVPRLHALDGLRGAAALAVVAFHAVDYVSMPPSVLSAWLMSPLGLFVNGPGAVHLFFVLSGYVLSLTLNSDAGLTGVPRYYVRRLFRIQPPYMVAVLIAWVASIGFTVVGGLGLWLQSKNPCFHIPGKLVPWALILPSMAFGQLPVGWSLYVELVMSLVFPVLFLVGRRVHALVPSALALFVLSPADSRFHMFRFTLDFSLGLALFVYHDALGRWLGRFPRVAIPVLLLAGVVLLQLPFALTRLETGMAALEQGHYPSTIISMSLGSAILVASALHLPPVGRFFSTPWALFFGRISYSLYLVHMPVLLFMICRVTGQRLPWYKGLAVFAVVLAISIGAAELMWRWVERPSIRAGRWVNGLLGRRRSAAQA